MTTCPNCNKPVSGRVCGYCGTSLVANYFTQTAHAKDQYPRARAGNLAATIIGIIGALTLLAAAAVQSLDFFSAAGFPQSSLFWWVRLLFLVFCGALFFVQQLVLRGLRFSMFFDGCWLFFFAAAIGLCSLLMLESGSAAFSGSLPVALLLLGGSGVCALSCIVSIIVYRKPG